MVRGKKILVLASIIVLIGITIFAVDNLKTPSLRTFGSGETTADVPQNVTGLSVEVMQYGTGDRKVKMGDYLLVRYEGKLSDGTIFATDLEQPEPYGFFIGRGAVIEGWEKGLKGMRINEKRKLTVSPDLGYGTAGIEGVPPNSTLTYEVHLLDIVD